MSDQLVASGSARIGAPARTVYDILADYRTGHPRILPPNFRNLEVVRGGIGAGTLITFDVVVLGQTKHFRAAVFEPEPGRRLIERDAEGITETEFVVTPLAANSCEVRITTVQRVREGLLGAIERWASKRFLESLYRDELTRLGALAAERTRD